MDLFGIPIVSFPVPPGSVLFGRFTGFVIREAPKDDEDSDDS